MTLSELFPGNVGRVELTRVAVRMRRPDLLRMPPTVQLDTATAQQLQAALAQVRRG